MSNLHIYTAPLQPATRFLDQISESEHWITFSPHTPLTCQKCHQRRWAQHL